MTNTFKFLITCVLILQAFVSPAQEVLSASGDHFKNSSGSLSFTIGEIITETFKHGDQILTQGLHQTNLVAVSIYERKGLDYEVSVFPNPARDYLVLKIDGHGLEGKRYLLFDIHGKCLKEGIIRENETEISFSGLVPSTYFMKVMEGWKEIKSFKIIKQ